MNSVRETKEGRHCKCLTACIHPQSKHIDERITPFKKSLISSTINRFLPLLSGQESFPLRQCSGLSFYSGGILRDSRNFSRDVSQAGEKGAAHTSPLLTPCRRTRGGSRLPASLRRNLALLYTAECSPSVLFSFVSEACRSPLRALSWLLGVNTEPSGTAKECGGEVLCKMRTHQPPLFSPSSHLPTQ